MVFIEEGNPLVYLDISMNNVRVGRLVIKLYMDKAPSYAEYFKTLCTDKILKGSSLQVFNKGCTIHCNAMLGSRSTNFNDKDPLKHVSRGLVSLNRDNPSEIKIITEPAPELDDTYVVFGFIINGLGVVRSIHEHLVPSEDIIIDCGEQQEVVCDLFAEDDTYPDWPHDFYIMPEEVSWWKSVVDTIKNNGTKLIETQNYKSALREHLKALRYLDYLLDMDIVEEESSARTEYASESLKAIKSEVESLEKADKFDLNDGVIKRDLAVAKMKIKCLEEKNPAFIKD